MKPIQTICFIGAFFILNIFNKKAYKVGRNDRSYWLPNLAHQIRPLGDHPANLAMATALCTLWSDVATMQSPWPW